VRERLNYLFHVLSNSAILLTREQVDLLWTQFHDEAVSTQERELLLRFIRRMVQPAPSHQAGWRSRVAAQLNEPNYGTFFTVCCYTPKIMLTLTPFHLVSISLYVSYHRLK
jgi:hypothetical protein